MLKIKNETDKSADIYISGEIVDDADANWIQDWTGSTDGYEFPAKLKNQLDSLKGKDLNIYINSYGGSIFDGVAMANMIKRHNGKTVATVDGICASIATQIFFSADVCRMPSNAYLMIHKPTAVSGGNAEDFRKTAEILDTLQQGLETTYQSKARDGVNAETIHNMVDKETWLTGDQAAEYFNIDVTGKLKAVACYGGRDKLKCKVIPADINFVGELVSGQDTICAENKIKVALSLAKGIETL